MLFYDDYAYYNHIPNCDKEYLKKLFDYCSIDDEQAKEYLQIIKDYYKRFDNASFDNDWIIFIK